VSASGARVFVLGAGRAGLSLTRAFVVSGVPVVGVHGRRPDPGPPAVTAGPIPPSLAHADIVLVTVRDAQVEDALAEVARAPLHDGAVILHASGALDPAGLTTIRTRGHPAGTFHPLVSLADPATAPERLRGAWIGIDGDPAAAAAARQLAARIGAHALVIPAGEKARYHAAAVFAANFPTVLASVAETLLGEVGIDAVEARSAVRRLMASALDNLATHDAATALTGPVARGDAESVARHLAVLEDDRAALDAYVALSTLALALAASRGGGDREGARAIARSLARAREAARDADARDAARDTDARDRLTTVGPPQPPASAD
jgi:predicted short-subunit dehydrogenase-like oxidoreductase (DUF2520 family)